MVTWQEVKDAAAKAGITSIDHHKCSICDEMVCYEVMGEQLYFNPACGCSWSPVEPRSWESAANYINMQARSGKHGDVGAEIAKQFGIDLPPVES